MYMSVMDLAENYCALAVAILKNVTLERAFDALDMGDSLPKTRTDITKQDEIDMYLLNKQGVTCRELADMYGIPEGTMYKKVWKIKQERKAYA